jgi:hypothetical protein
MADREIDPAFKALVGSKVDEGTRPRVFAMPPASEEMIRARIEALNSGDSMIAMDMEAIGRDFEALGRDFEAVGDDMRRAMLAEGLPPGRISEVHGPTVPPTPAWYNRLVDRFRRRII